MASKRRRKPKSTKRLAGQLWTDGDFWTVKSGILKRRQGRPSLVRSLFLALGEKLPFDSLLRVRQHARSLGIKSQGMYVAHDSMGTPRYIGRGAIWSRLRARRRAHPHELAYFSFYVIKDKIHEREIETLLIRAAGPSPEFNTRKKRVGIKPGSVKDFEAGTVFFERRTRRKGKRVRTSVA
jgi:hypothetical protein